jgi:hypothetical protein
MTSDLFDLHRTLDPHFEQGVLERPLVVRLGLCPDHDGFAQGHGDRLQSGADRHRRATAGFDDELALCSSRSIGESGYQLEFQVDAARRRRGGPSVCRGRDRRKGEGKI